MPSSPTMKAVSPWQERLDSSGRHEVQIWSKFVWKVLTNGHARSTTKCCSDRYAYALRRQRASVAFRWSPSCEFQVWADRRDSLKCRSGTQERELGVQLVTLSDSFLMRYYFALFSTKTFECSVSPPTFRHYSDSRWPVFSPIICILCKERSYMRPCTWLIPKLYDEYQWTVLRKVYIGMPSEFHCLLYRCKLFIGLWCIGLICPISLCLYIQFQRWYPQAFPSVQ